MIGIRRILRAKWDSASVRQKMLLSFVFPIVLILITNIYMYISINTMIEKVDEIYISNVSLNELSDNLNLIQSAMKEYLENKATSSLNSYYIAEQDYSDCVENLKNQSSTGQISAMQDNIIHQSDNYLKLAQETIQAKRGRNVEKYKSCYEESEQLRIDLQNCIYSLNSSQFKRNTEDYSVLLSSLKYMEIITMIILLFIGVVNVCVVYFITRSMTMPLIDLSRAANEVATGNFNVEIAEVEGEDEISVVSKAFKQMVSSIQRYISEIRERMSRESELKEHELVMESRMKEVQLRSLQAQINPHFLFNTLNAGAQLAMMEDAEKTTEFIQNMADFFRYNIKKIDNDATIREEVTMVNRYIYLLNVRFTGEIQFSEDVDDTVIDVRVPSMILQPIVENAVNYGIRGIDREGHINLKVYRVDNMVYMSVSDNGRGISSEKIEQILAGEISESTEDSAGSNGIGLGNVIERLQIFTGRRDVMEIFSEGEDKGSEFIIKVPMHV